MKFRLLRLILICLRPLTFCAPALVSLVSCSFTMSPIVERTECVKMMWVNQLDPEKSKRPQIDLINVSVNLATQTVSWRLHSNIKRIVQEKEGCRILTGDTFSCESTLHGEKIEFVMRDGRIKVLYYDSGSMAYGLVKVQDSLSCMLTRIGRALN